MKCYANYCEISGNVKDLPPRLSWRASSSSSAWLWSPFLPQLDIQCFTFPRRMWFHKTANLWHINWIRAPPSHVRSRFRIDRLLKMIIKLSDHTWYWAQTFVILLSLLKSKNSCVGPTCPHFTPRLCFEVFGHLDWRKWKKALESPNIP